MTDPTTTETPAPTPPTTPTITIPAGAHVRSRFAPEWGTGVVMGREGKRVRVLFMAHPERKPVVISPASLAVEHVGSWPDVSMDLEPAAGTSKRRAGAKTQVPGKSREEALKLFLAAYPGGFTDPKYVETERAHKWEAHELFASTLDAATRASLLAAGNASELATRALAVEEKTKLLHRMEKTRFHDALGEPETTLGFFRALHVLLEAKEMANPFGLYVKAVESLPRPSGRADIWTVATVLPFLAQPERFLFVKPRPTQAAAVRYDLDLQYKSALGWTTYGQALKLAHLVRADLDPHGCKDMIDVQSYIWLAE